MNEENLKLWQKRKDKYVCTECSNDSFGMWMPDQCFFPDIVCTKCGCPLPVLQEE